MGKTVIKDTFREIKGSFGRFFAIFAIVAIGVSFFAGITASSSDMRYSSDSYYDEYNLFDLRLLSDAGFTDDDIKAIRETDGVKGVFAAHEADVLTTIGNAITANSPFSIVKDAPASAFILTSPILYIFFTLLNSI